MVCEAAAYDDDAVCCAYDGEDSSSSRLDADSTHSRPTPLHPTRHIMSLHHTHAHTAPFPSWSQQRGGVARGVLQPLHRDARQRAVVALSCVCVAWRLLRSGRLLLLCLWSCALPLQPAMSSAYRPATTRFRGREEGGSPHRHTHSAHRSRLSPASHTPTLLSLLHHCPPSPSLPPAGVATSRTASTGATYDAHTQPRVPGAVGQCPVLFLVCSPDLPRSCLTLSVTALPPHLSLPQHDERRCKAEIDAFQGVRQEARGGSVHLPTQPAKH